jgi:hypothetical protein
MTAKIRRLWQPIKRLPAEGAAMKRRMSALLRSGCVLPLVRGYLQTLGCFLLQIAVLLLLLSAGGPHDPPPAS